MKTDQKDLLSKQALDLELSYKFRYGDERKYVNIETYGEYLKFLEFIQELDIPKLNSYQSKIVLEYLTSYDYIDRDLPRQCGKSNIGLLLMCYMAISKPDSKILITTHSRGMTSQFLKLDCNVFGEDYHEPIITKLINMGKIDKVGKQHNSHIIEFANGSTITLTIPTDIEDVVYDYTYMDEFIFYNINQFSKLLDNKKLKNRLLLSSQPIE